MIRWYAVHCQPRGEDKAAFHLRRQGFRVYVPRYLKRRRHARRTDWVPAPLFPRYLFVAMDVAACRWRAIDSTVGVSHLVRQGDRPAPVPEAVLDEIRRHEDAAGMVVLARAAALSPGDRVTILDGPLADRIGLVEGVSDEERVTILLALLGREVRIRVPLAAVGVTA